MTLDRVAKANSIYQMGSTFLRRVHAMQLWWSVENPTSSLLWSVPYLLPLMTEGFTVDFDMCMFGSERRTKRTFLTNVPQFRNLSVSCDGKHSHKPSRKVRMPSGKLQLATKDEAAYPRPLCLQVVALLARQAQVDLHFTPPHESANSAASVGKQARGRKVPPLVPEFRAILHLQVACLPAVDSKRRLLQPCGDAPAGSKLLSTSQIGLEEGDGCARFAIVIGVYACKAEFFEAAKAVGHPFDRLDALDDNCKRLIVDMVAKGPQWIAKRRTAKLREWIKLAVETQCEEDSWFAGLDPGVAHVLAGKRVVLLRKLAASIGWVDQRLFEEIGEGFDLVGDHLYSGVFQREVRPRSLPVDEFFRNCKYLRPALLGKVKASTLDEVGKELWEKTVAETSTGLLEGPLTVEELHARYGDAWVPVRRFGVLQSSGPTRKLRAIDDFTENRVNLAFSYQDKLDLRALDVITAFSRAWIRAFTCDEGLILRLSHGTELCARPHPSWKQVDGEAGWLPLVTTLDLKGAYKQFPISLRSRALNVVALRDPTTGDLGLFEGKALPFGSAASVLHFNRLSRLLWRLGLEVGLCWGNFYDDYPIMSPACLASSTMTTMLMLCKLLGFAYTEEKLKEFARRATMLGVELDLSYAGEGFVHLCNKEGRAGDVVRAIDSAVGEGRIDRKTFSRIAGRVQFADAQVMGRSGRLALADLRAWSTGKFGMSLDIDNEAIRYYEILVRRLSIGTPRSIPCKTADDVRIVFTDGSSEGDDHLVGGILWSLCLDSPRFFACRVSPKLVDEWSADLARIIGPVEMYAVIVARFLWHQFISGARVIYFIDNFGVLDAFIKGSSTSRHFRRLLAAFEQHELNGHSWSWFNRVPSESNCADDPSRGVFRHLLNSGYCRDSCLCPVTGAPLEDLAESDG